MSGLLISGLLMGMVIIIILYYFHELKEAKNEDEIWRKEILKALENRNKRKR